MTNFYQNNSYNWWKKLAIILFIIFATSPLTGQTLVWEENFDGTTINPETWTFDFGDGCERGICGWGNQELQYYTSRPENARIEDGSLVIEARRENFGGKEFTSARLKTIGRVQLKYGTLEARIKMPDLENGLWPAFWLLGATGNWPASGEIDIMEMGNASGIQQNLVNRRVGAAAHWENNDSYAGYGEYYDVPADLNNDYHLYKMTWDSQFIRAYVDDVLFYTIDISGATAADLEEFHKQHYILLNLAVGGSYTGILNAAGITAPLPAKMEIDYIRLFQNEGDELFLGTESALSGNFGVYSESTNLSNRLTYGEDAELYIWNNLSSIGNATPYEGNEVLALRAAAGNWFGFGVENQPKNLLNYADGFLKFHFKSSYTGQFKIGVKSGHGESWINFAAGLEQHGLVRDGEWHEVSIPLSDFNNPAMGMHIDLGSITQSFMFAGDAASAEADFYIDNIYYSGGVASNPAPVVSIASPANEALLTTGQDMLITANASDENGTVSKVEFYNGNTLLGTAEASPFSFTWADVPSGVYNLLAKATDDEGAVGTSAVIRVFVAAEDNQAPFVSITSPEAGATFTQPASITINADASDADGSVYKVEFYNGETLLGADFTSPYSFNWTGVMEGSYTLTAKVTDNGKLEETSLPVSITVGDNSIVADQFGVFTDDSAIENKLTLGVDAYLYIWNNLSAIPNAAPYEGANVLAFTAGAGNWFGMGIANDSRNLQHFAEGSLKFNMKLSSSNTFKIGILTESGESWVNFIEGLNQYGLVRDGEWHEVLIPMSAFNVDLASVTQMFMIAGDAPAAPLDLFIDHIYYSVDEPGTPGEYCGTAQNGDFAFSANTANDMVNVTFHPLDPIAGSDFVILHIRPTSQDGWPGYIMAASGTYFTYSIPAPEDGTELSIYFTYRVSAGGGERNSLDDIKYYVTGSTCGEEECETVFYADADGDGFGNQDDTIIACDAPAGYVDSPGDCNDSDASIKPGATDVCDGIDRNCDGSALQAMEAPEISVTPSSNEYTGGDDKTLFLGYGPTSVTLLASHATASQYNWELDGETVSNEANFTFEPTAAGIYAFTVTVVNEDNCLESASETINVTDIRAGKKGKQAWVCLNGKTKAANINSIPSLLEKGATLGSCGNTQASNLKLDGFEEVALSVYPNPSIGETNISFYLSNSENYQLTIFNMAGALVKNISGGTATYEGNHVKSINTRELKQGVYLIKLSSDYQSATVRLIIQQ